MKIAMGKFAGLGAALLLVLPIAASAQGMGQQTQQSQPPPQSPQTPAVATPPPVDPAEEAAFKQVRDLNTTDPKLIVSSGEDFIKKFPNSKYSGAVYSRLTSAYMQLGDTDHMFAAGNKALAVIPDNVDVLPVMAMATSRRIDPGALDADQKERTVKSYATQGIMLINQLPRPTDASADQWDRARDVKLSMCHSGLGLVDYDQGKFTEAIQEFTEALKLEHDPDPVDQYLLGVSFSATKDFTNAITNLDACGKQDGSMQAICKRALDEAKKKAAAQPKQ